jgi:hypothetical protein
MLAEFADDERLLAAARAMRARGYLRVDAFSPHPVAGMEEALGLGRSPLTALAWPLGLFGAAFAFFLQWLLVAYLYPLNVGGRPPFSIPAFIIVAFETMVLFASCGVFALFFWICRLPRLAHPLFTAEGFDRVSSTAFLLGVDAADARFDSARTQAELEALGASRITFTAGHA